MFNASNAIKNNIIEFIIIKILIWKIQPITRFEKKTDERDQDISLLFTIFSFYVFWIFAASTKNEINTAQKQFSFNGTVAIGSLMENNEPVDLEKKSEDIKKKQTAFCEIFSWIVDRCKEQTWKYFHTEKHLKVESCRLRPSCKNSGLVTGRKVSLSRKVFTIYIFCQIRPINIPHEVVIRRYFLQKKWLEIKTSGLRRW